MTHDFEGNSILKKCFSLQMLASVCIRSWLPCRTGFPEDCLTLWFVFNQILLLSMKDMNIAKLTCQDLPLFNGIVSDLFPGVETPTIDYGKVKKQHIRTWMTLKNCCHINPSTCSFAASHCYRKRHQRGWAQATPFHGTEGDSVVRDQKFQVL